jgi:hypothetical protein
MPELVFLPEGIWIRRVQNYLVSMVRSCKIHIQRISINSLSQSLSSLMTAVDLCKWVCRTTGYREWQCGLKTQFALNTWYVHIYIYNFIYILLLVSGFNPSETYYSSRLGLLFPIYGEIKKCSKPPSSICISPNNKSYNHLIFSAWRYPMKSPHQWPWLRKLNRDTKSKAHARAKFEGIAREILALYGTVAPF